MSVDKTIAITVRGDSYREELHIHRWARSQATIKVTVGEQELEITLSDQAMIELASDLQHLSKEIVRESQ